MRLPTGVLRVVALTVFGVFAMAVTAAPADAGWSRPRSLEVKGYQGSSDSSVARAGGWTVAAWTASDNDPNNPTAVRVRTITPHGSMGRVRTFNRLGSEPALPASGMGPRGHGILAWASSTNDGGWAVLERGIHGSRLGAVHRLTAPDDDMNISDWLPQVTVNAAGRALVTWDHVHTGRPTLIEGRFISRQGHVGALHVFHQSLGWNPEAIAWCPDGSFVVGSRINQRDLLLQRLGRGRGRPRTRNATTDLPGRLAEAEISCDASNQVRALVNLRRRNDTHPWSVHLRTWRRTGGLTPARRVTPRRELPVSIGLATDGRGRSVVGWYEALLPSSAYRLHTRYVSAAGRLAGERDLCRIKVPPVNGFDQPPRVTMAVDRTGRGAITWTRLMKDGYDTVTYGMPLRRGGGWGPKTLLARYAGFARVASPTRGRSVAEYVVGRNSHDMRLRFAP